MCVNLLFLVHLGTLWLLSALLHWCYHVSLKFINRVYRSNLNSYLFQHLSQWENIVYCRPLWPKTTLILANYFSTHAMSFLLITMDFIYCRKKNNTSVTFSYVCLHRITFLHSPRIFFFHPGLSYQFNRNTLLLFFTLFLRT